MISQQSQRVAAELPRFWRYIWCELEWSMRHSVSQIIVAFSKNYFKFWIDVTFFGYFIKRAASKWSKFEASFSSLHEIVGCDCDHVRIDDRYDAAICSSWVWNRLLGLILSRLPWRDEFGEAVEESTSTIVCSAKCLHWIVTIAVNDDDMMTRP